MPDRIERLSLLAQALGSNPDWSDLSRLIVLRIFDSWGCSAAALFAPASDGSFALEASFGYSDDAVAALHVVSREADSVLVPAMRSDEIIWLPDPVDVAGAAGDTPLGLEGSQAMVVLPITRLGIPERALVLSFTAPLPANPASEPFVVAIRSLLELTSGSADWPQRSMPGSGHTPVAHPTSANEVELTTRQQRILRLLAQEKTNRSIAAELGFSESTIRQETLRLYRALGVNSRTDAVRVAQSIGLLA